jgi:hypothetical protein
LIACAVGIASLRKKILYLKINFIPKQEKELERCKKLNDHYFITKTNKERNQKIPETALDSRERIDQGLARRVIQSINRSLDENFQNLLQQGVTLEELRLVRYSYTAEEEESIQKILRALQEQRLIFKYQCKSTECRARIQL